jgi:hypothetical protein
MAKGNEDKRDHIDNEPRIYGIRLDANKQKIFDRRDFIKAVTAAGATIALTGCHNKSNEDQMAEALEKTLQAREREGGSEDSEEKDSEIQVPSTTDNKVSTNTPTEESTNTGSPELKGEVATAHSLFMGPHVDDPVFSDTVVGEEVTILGKTEDGIWFKIKDANGDIGWCYAEFINPLTGASIPTIYNVPTPVSTPCDCDEYGGPCAYCTCDAICTCDDVHYWYPN